MVLHVRVTPPLILYQEVVTVASCSEMVLTTEHVVAIGGKAFGQLKKEQESSLDEMNQVWGNITDTCASALYAMFIISTHMPWPVSKSDQIIITDTCALAGL